MKLQVQFAGKKNKWQFIDKTATLIMDLILQNDPENLHLTISGKLLLSKYKTIYFL